RLGITWLERESLVLQGVRFIGTTLWTDFDALAPADGDLTRVLRARAKAFRAADFYLSKTAATRRGQPFMAQAWREQSLVCQQWLRLALAEPFDGATVVVTHFAPSLRSADPRYGQTPGTAGFCNSLDALLPLAHLWIHGHLHCQQDYQHAGCRVVANTLGYAVKNEQSGFRPQWLLDVNAAH
ncbi:MAG: metallophosphoesterase, partial [Pseudomonadota bacterium]|nr:metallophosphoesterase [Pseudomonadota bacterium]